MNDRSVGPSSLTAETFIPLEGSTFAMTPPGLAPFDVTLAAVHRGRRGPVREQFSLVFVGGPTPPAPQGMVGLRHEHLGTVDLFVVPLGPGPDGQRYEAAFS